jgi:hypothetical protein
VGIAKVHETDGLMVAVAADLEECECVLVAGDSFAMAAEMMIGVADAVPRIRGGDPVTAFALYVQARTQ